MVPLNKFGGYVNSKIDKYQYKENNQLVGKQIIDPKAFVFSLKSNGRIDGMKKFENKDPSNGITFICSRQFTCEFAIGDGCDICLKKESFSGSHCNQFSFNYGNIETGLVGPKASKTYFTPKRFVVIQMK